jgi:vancomycin resistance protein YoaR
MRAARSSRSTAAAYASSPQTLYNTAVMADLEIVFRRNHSMPVTYIDKGLDATINSVGT